MSLARGFIDCDYIIFAIYEEELLKSFTPILCE